MRRPSPGPKEWLSQPRPIDGPRRSLDRPPHDLEVVRVRDLHVLRVALHRRDRDAVAGERLGLVDRGRAASVSVQRGDEQLAPRALRCLRPSQAVALDGGHDQAASTRLSASACGRHRDGRADPVRRLGDRGYDRGRDDRPGAVVDEDHARRRRRDSRRDGVLASCATGHDQALAIADPRALRDPIDAVRCGHDDGPGHETRIGHRLDRPLEHGPAADHGVELVETAHPVAAAGRDDDGVDPG